MLKATKFGKYRNAKGTKVFKYKVTGNAKELKEFAAYQKSQGMQEPILADGSVLYLTAFNKVNKVTTLERKWDGSGYNHLDEKWEDFEDSVSAITDTDIKAVYITKQIDSAIGAVKAVMAEAASGFDDEDDDDDSDDEDNVDDVEDFTDVEEIVSEPVKKTNRK
jgi:hypothetical protein